MKKRLLLLLTVIAALSAASCNTMRGFGADVQRAGGALQEAASH